VFEEQLTVLLSMQHMSSYNRACKGLLCIQGCQYMVPLQAQQPVLT
jgi:hypothetical protein